MSKKKKPKSYEINTFEQLCNIANKENVENLSLDLVKWLGIYTAYVTAIREQHPRDSKGVSNWDIVKGDFIWIDDGKSELKKVSIKDQKTGEIKYVNLGVKGRV